MKLPVLLALALSLAACEKAIFSPDATPAPAPPAAATPPPASPTPKATPPLASPAPKPGAWMKDSKSALDKSGKLGEKGKK